MKWDAAMTGWLASIGETDGIAICSITRGEILFGLERLAHGRRRKELEERATKLLSGLRCEPVPESAGDRYAVLKREQQRRGLSLDEMTFGLRPRHLPFTPLWSAAIATSMGSKSC